MRTAIRAWLASLSMMTAVAAHAGVGVRTMSIPPVEGTPAGPMPIAVWYPTPVPEGAAWEEMSAAQHATRDAPVSPGRHPVLLWSHGSGGNEWGHADLAEALAARGWIVAVPRHRGDSSDAPEGLGTDVQVVGRTWQARAAIDAVLAAPAFADHVDAARVAIGGFSAGGYTALVLGGAEPDFALLRAHCREHPDDAGVCLGGSTTLPRVTRPDWRPVHDPRVRAVVAFAPFSVPFDRAGLAGVRVPVKLVAADDDHVLRNEFNTDHIAPLLPGAPKVEHVAGGHYVFIAPCGAWLRKNLPLLCTDPPGVDRAALHVWLAAEVGDFLEATLR